MGTRSTLHIQDDNNKTIASVYRQYDGYPTGMGQDIFDILNKGQVELRNGFAANDKVPAQFNGIECLGAYLIGQLKGDSIGNVYLTTADDRQEYDYFITSKNDTVHLRIQDYVGTTLFDNILSEFNSELVEQNM
jgi:hypothetical protein